MLVVLEDIHWADRSTRELLAFLARNLRAERIVVLATYRVDDELPAGLRRLAVELGRRRTVLRIELEPLGARGRRAPARGDRGRPVPRELAGELHARAGGNPFFVEELFAARDAVPATVDRGGAGAGRAARPVAQATLAMLAAAGGRASHTLLEPARRRTPDALRAGARTPGCWCAPATASRSGTG